MQRTVIHIGYPKTATKWFVKHFYPRLKNATVLYDDDLSFSIAQGNEYFEIKHNKETDNNELLALVSHKFCGIVEGYWRNGAYRPFFIKHLKKQFPNASIVVFIRNQLDFIPSIYSSYLKRGGTYKIDELFRPEHLIDKDFFSFAFLKYPDLIKLYQEAFGAENVHCFVYEEFLENNMLFLEKYINKVHFDIDVDKLCLSKTNEKLRKGLTLVRYTNLFFSRGTGPKKHVMNLPWIYPLINKRLDKLNEYKIWGEKVENKKMLTPELTDFINNYFKESNKQLINEFELDSIKKYGYPL